MNIGLVYVGEVGKIFPYICLKMFGCLEKKSYLCIDFDVEWSA